MIKHGEYDQRDNRRADRYVELGLQSDQAHGRHCEQRERKNAWQPKLSCDEQRHIRNRLAPAFLVPLVDRDQAVIPTTDATWEVIGDLNKGRRIKRETVLN